jgi:glutamate-1-semialdehyde aminotransferase
VTPGTEADWTLSIAHSEPEVERYVAAFEEFASEVTNR